MTVMLGIDYDERHPESYRGVFVLEEGRRRTFSTGQVRRDWNDARAYLRSRYEEDQEIATLSSVDHFVEDVKRKALNN